MYGTDWSMLAQDHPYDQDYYGLMKTRFPSQLGLSMDETLNMLGGNAARFVGLSKINGQLPDTREGAWSPSTRTPTPEPRHLALWD